MRASSDVGYTVVPSGLAIIHDRPVLYAPAVKSTHTLLSPFSPLHLCISIFRPHFSLFHLLFLSPAPLLLCNIFTLPPTLPSPNPLPERKITTARTPSIRILHILHRPLYPTFSSFKPFIFAFSGILCFSLTSHDMPIHGSLSTPYRVHCYLTPKLCPSMSRCTSPDSSALSRYHPLHFVFVFIQSSLLSHLALT